LGILHWLATPPAMSSPAPSMAWFKVSRTATDGAGAADDELLVLVLLLDHDDEDVDEEEYVLEGVQADEDEVVLLQVFEEDDQVELLGAGGDQVELGGCQVEVGFDE